MIEIYYRPKKTDMSYVESESFDVETIKDAKEIFNKTTNKYKEYVIVETKKYKDVY